MSFYDTDDRYDRTDDRDEARAYDDPGEGYDESQWAEIVAIRNGQ